MAQYTYRDKKVAQQEAKAKDGKIKENKRKSGTTYTVKFDWGKGK